MNKFLKGIGALAVSGMLFTSCKSAVGTANDENNVEGELKTAIDSLLAGVKGDVGVAVITSEGDTVVAGNQVKYPLMSVFKLHEAIAVAHEMDRDGTGFDSVINIKKGELDPDTWSPLLKTYPHSDMTLPISELMSYMLVYSDNNASNILFERIVTVAATDSLIQSIIPEKEFSLKYTEAQMADDHSLAYSNWSSPLACASLINRVFTDSIVSGGKQKEIKRWLGECSSANDRLAMSLKNIEGAKLYHRTGSGYVNEKGEILAVNDVGFVELPGGGFYSIAVLVKDFPGTQEEASSIIAKIGEAVALVISEKI